MNKMKLDLAISPCPNDTYIFQAFRNPHFLGEEITLVMEDVEELNRRALQEKRHSFTKISFFALSRLERDYTLLPCGGAMGRGCGPLLLSSLPLTEKELRSSPPDRILIPGIWTTAHFLTRLFLTNLGIDPLKIEFVPVRYDKIMRLLAGGEERFGVIIHEDRFIYKNSGLYSQADLGAFWEGETGLPIPLGCIAARNDIMPETRGRMITKIRESLVHAGTEWEETLKFIRLHAQSLDENVIRSHIALYVNDFSFDFGEEGERAVSLFLRKAREMSLPTN